MQKPLRLFAALICLVSGCSQEASTPPAADGARKPAPVTLIAPLANTIAPSPAATAIPVPPGAVLGGIDGVSGDLRKGGSMLVVGWAIDTQFGAPVARVDVVLDDLLAVEAKLGDRRPDISQQLNRRDADFAGWTATFDLTRVEPGRHIIKAFVYDTRQNAYVLPVSQTVEIR
jgi:hypothetical protein